MIDVIFAFVMFGLFLLSWYGLLGRIAMIAVNVSLVCMSESIVPIVVFFIIFCMAWESNATSWLPPFLMRKNKPRD